jgi:small subunit ribosomal protein S9
VTHSETQPDAPVAEHNPGPAAAPPAEAAVASAEKAPPAVETVVVPKPRAKRRGGYVIATGRRKTAVARVRLKAGSGKVVVNGREIAEYFPIVKDRALVLSTLDQVERRGAVDVDVTVHGGGTHGQAGACRLGIARALKEFDDSLSEPLRQGGLLTRDGRMKERKKYGLRGARRGTQFSKR